MKDIEQREHMSLFARVVAFLALAMNLIQLAIFVTQMISGEAFKQASFVMAQFVTFALVFSLAIFLFYVSGGRRLDRSHVLMRAFSWVYVGMSAIVLCRLSYVYSVHSALFKLELLSSLAFVAMAALLGGLVMRFAYGSLFLLAFPYMLVFLIQAGIWLVMSANMDGQGSQHIAQILLLAYTGSLIVALLRFEAAPKRVVTPEIPSEPA